ERALARVAHAGLARFSARAGLADAGLVGALAARADLVVGAVRRAAVVHVAAGGEAGLGVAARSVGTDGALDADLLGRVALHVAGAGAVDVELAGHLDRLAAAVAALNRRDCECSRERQRDRRAHGGRQYTFLREVRARTDGRARRRARCRAFLAFQVGPRAADRVDGRRARHHH